MPVVDLSDNEWNQLMALLGNKCLWVEANPLLMKIGAQLQKQIAIHKQTNSGEMPINTGEIGVKQ